MRWLAGLLLALYPRPWRERYGDELEALLEELRVGPAELADLLVGALVAHTYPYKENATMKNLLPAALVAALIVPLTIAASLLLLSTGHMTEPGGEFLLLFAPLLTVPLIALLPAAYPDGSPGRNRATLWLGVGSATVMGVLAFLSIALSIFSSPVTPIPLMTTLFVAAACGLALWFVLNGWLVLRGGKAPAVLGLLGMLVGVLSLVIFVTSNGQVQAGLPRESFFAVMNIVTPLWLVTLPVWAVWSAAWLWLRRGKGMGNAVVGKA